VPSPVGHSLAGLCGFILARQRLGPIRESWLSLGSIFIANMPDLDFLPGLILGDPRFFHHKGLHSFMAAAAIGLLTIVLSGRWNLSRIRWSIWAAGLYVSHVLLDTLAHDPIPPFGVQLFWPFSESYFTSSITPFARFDYFYPDLGIMGALLSTHNIIAVLQEITLMALLVGLVWYFRSRRWRTQETNTWIWPS